MFRVACEQCFRRLGFGRGFLLCSNAEYTLIFHGTLGDRGAVVHDNREELEGRADVETERPIRI